MNSSLSPSLAERLVRPLDIGRHRIGSRLLLAPMTGVGNVAFRELVSTFGGYGLLFMEMCSAKTLPTENRFTSLYFRWREEELRFLVCQIVGDTPECMANAARRIEDEGFWGVDINFGCSVAAICKKNAGAAVLKNPQLAQQIVSAVRRAVSLPVFVKFRTGWTDAPEFPVEMAMRFEEAGADALTFHPRVAPDRRTRPPRWDYIRNVKEAVSIPVFGNGNVFSSEDCLRLLETTGCDGIAVGRMAVARPWIFSEWSAGFQASEKTPIDCAFALIALLKKHFDPRDALRRFKQFALYFSANFYFGHSLFSRLRNGASLEEEQQILIDFFSLQPKIQDGPNLNLFT